MHRCESGIKSAVRHICRANCARLVRVSFCLHHHTALRAYSLEIRPKLAEVVPVQSSAAADESVLLDVHFRPYLWEERHAWILRILRQENARTVLDIGCGEGALLSTLCQPAQTIWEPSLGESENEAYRDLYLERIAGLDIVPTELIKAERATTPAAPAAQPSHKTWVRDPIRWNPLEVKLWHGSLDTYNPDLKSYDFMVAMEVIEHLPENILPYFAPMILGQYRPKCLLVTTPNFSFNPLFTKPGHTDPRAFPDPTGRTNRHFRHDDHKFEWTEQEFREWCEDAAAAFGYEVLLGGVGQPTADDPYRRPAPFASQTALFRRKAEDAPVSKRHLAATARQDVAAVPHALVACHIHQAHPSSGILQPLDDIRGRIRESLDESQYGDTTIRDLWNDWQIPFMCGGSLSCLLEAIQEGDSEWELKATEESTKNRLAVAVLWKAFVPRAQNALEEEDANPEGSEIDVDHYESQEDDRSWPERQDRDVPADEPNDWGWGSAESTNLQQNTEWGTVQDWGTDAGDTTTDETGHSAWAQIPE
ncbi:hypothetical protein CALVIDRAFT_509770 [Calocera viscosa TUFC12733]|uniref:Small RNA 2'-O-methyltransferase n=1 Tax=Calocera viscosa (strain TUFC12733) TaxID=1330018 RepID=A0A167R3C4_CALVF|nr:hypothetical protein CALVIDRAFT_509770 [Calocera viscosa TUFC12733]